MTKNYAKLEQQRVADNIKLLRLLNKIMIENPSLRFGQILTNYGFVTTKEVTIDYGRGNQSVEMVWMDEFYTEPSTVLKRVENELQRQSSNT